jgi:hypothetical protein
MAFEFISKPLSHVVDNESGVTIGFDHGFYDDGETHFWYKDADVEFTIGSKFEGRPMIHAAYLWTENVDDGLGFALTGFMKKKDEPLSPFAMKYRERVLPLINQLFAHGSLSLVQLILGVRILPRKVVPEMRERIMRSIRDGVYVLMTRAYEHRMAPDFRVELVSRSDLRQSKEQSPN